MASAPSQAAAQATTACEVSWLDAASFEALVRLELSSVADHDALQVSLSACTDTGAHLHVRFPAGTTTERDVDLADVPPAARARLLALSARDLVWSDPATATAATPMPAPTLEPTAQVLGAARPEGDAPQDGAAAPAESASPSQRPREDESSTRLAGSPPTPDHDAELLDGPAVVTPAPARWSVGLGAGVDYFTAHGTPAATSQARGRYGALLLRLSYATTADIESATMAATPFMPIPLSPGVTTFSTLAASAGWRWLELAAGPFAAELTTLAGAGAAWMNALPPSGDLLGRSGKSVVAPLARAEVVLGVHASFWRLTCAIEATAGYQYGLSAVDASQDERPLGGVHGLFVGAVAWLEVTL